MKIYLAGPIHHVAPEQATGWRRKVTEQLEPLGYEILDPTAGKDLYQPGVNTTVFTPEYITTTDIAMVDAADIIIVDISQFVPMIGTSMEVYHASTTGKKVYTWGETNKGSYWMRQYATEMYNTLEALLCKLEMAASANKIIREAGVWKE